MKRYILIPVAVVVVFLIALASWISLSHSNNTDMPMRTVTDATGATITIPQHPKRVVILNSANLDMYYAVGGTVVGKPTSSYISKEIREKTKDVPAVGTLHSPSVEAIIGLHPDLVIGLNVPFNTGLRGILEDADIPLYINNLTTYEEVFDTLTFFGELTNQPDVAKATADKAMANYNKLIDDAKKQKGPRSLIIFGAPGSFSMATNKAFSGNLLSLLNGYNIADAATGLEGDYVPLSMEYVIKQDPEVIFFISMSPKSDSVNVFKREMLNSSAWSDVSAVKNQRIYYLSGGLFAANPGTRISEALQIMYDDLYGEEAAHDEP